MSGNNWFNHGKPAGRVLVTGAAGFIGSHLCERLLAEGYEVVGVDNFLTGRVENIRNLTHMAGFRFLEHDIVEPLRLDGPLGWIFHLASPAAPPQYQRHAIECLRCNSEGTYHLLELARRREASFMLGSTSEVYGDPDVHPQTESYWGNVNPIGPRSMYDEAKRYAEAITVEFHRRYGLDTRIVRIFNTYGPRMAPDDGRVISNFATQALRGKRLTVYGDGSQTRSFQYIDDLLEGMVRLMETPCAAPLNLGNPTEFTILELAHLTRKLVRVPVEIEFKGLPVDPPRRPRRPDISVARRLLGWQPRVSLAEGLRHTIAYFRKQLGIGVKERPVQARPAA